MLLPLPQEDYVLSNSQECNVSTNCHISYKGNYYSVPYGYVGKTVNVVEMNGLLRIYSDKKEIALHSLATCEFIRNKENIAFIGPSGTGKTHLSIAIGINAISQGYSVLFTTVNQMLDELYMARADNSVTKKLRKYINPDLLILDELGLNKLSQNNIDDFY